MADVRVKICGVCRPVDAANARACGADYIGVIVAPGRKRSQPVESAVSIFDAADDAQRVGVFIDANVAEVCAMAERLRIDVVQLHGKESGRDVIAIRRAGFRVWKVFRGRDAVEVVNRAEHYEVDGYHFDGWSDVAEGGTGSKADWHALARAVPPRPMILAGGLTSSNVSEAIRVLRPDVVDVSSGIESVPCEKSMESMAAFIAAVRAS